MHPLTHSHLIMAAGDTGEIPIIRPCAWNFGENKSQSVSRICGFVIPHLFEFADGRAGSSDEGNKHFFLFTTSTNRWRGVNHVGHHHDISHVGNNDRTGVHRCAWVKGGHSTVHKTTFLGGGIGIYSISLILGGGMYFRY